MSHGLGGIQPHPQNPNAYCLTHLGERENPRPLGAVEFMLDTWTNPQDPYPIAVNFAFGEGNLCLAENNDESLASSLLLVLCKTHTEANHLVVWNGKGVVFHTFLRHLARPMTAMGCTIKPMVTGVDIKAITIIYSGMQWLLLDIGVMSGLSLLSQDAICDSFGATLHQGMTTANRLLVAAKNLQNHLRDIVGVGIRPTIAAVSLRAARRYLREDARWFRPNLGLESICRHGGAYRGGYTYSEPYQGEAWRIDVNKMYTSLLRSPLPSHCNFGHAGQKGKEHPGFFLCRIEGQGHFPPYITSFHIDDSRFHKQHLNPVSAWAFLPSCEFAGLRHIGYDVTAGLGWRIDDWVSFKGYADHLLSLQTRYERGSPQSLLAKMLGNSLTGKLGQSPERLEVCYSIGEPGAGWLPYVTVEREIVDHLWFRQKLDFKGGQHVDAAAWLTASGRGMVYRQLARIKALGWRAMHVDTDGVIINGDPRGILQLSPDVPGMWRYEGFDPECIVAKGKWYSFNGENHAAGVANVTREQIEAVHQGRHIVMGRKVLRLPYTNGPITSDQSYSLGA